MSRGSGTIGGAGNAAASSEETGRPAKATPRLRPRRRGQAALPRQQPPRLDRTTVSDTRAVSGARRDAGALSYFSLSTRINGAGNGKLAAPSTSVLPSKTIVAVAVAERWLRVEPGPFTVVLIGPVAVQVASTETVCNPPRLSSTLANVPPQSPS